MKYGSVGLKIFVATVALISTACSGGGSGAIDQLFGGFTSPPILTSIPDQIVSQSDLLTIDVNNIKDGSPGSDQDMSYSCFYDTTVDGTVESTLACADIPNSTVSFGTANGILSWTPNSGILGNHEVRIHGVNADGQYDEIFTVGVRLNFDGIDQYTAISGTSVTMSWVPNSSAIGYQIFRLNTTTGLYELFHTVTGGSSSGVTLTGLTPNTPYTFRAQAQDALGNLDGNVVSRSCTTTTLTRFSMTPATATRAAGTPVNITVQAFNNDGSPQTVGGVTITPFIQSGTSTGTFSTVTDNNNGTYSFSFTPSAVGTPVSIALNTNLTFFLDNTADITVIPGAPSSTNSSLNISSTTVVSGNAVTLTATIRDAYNNPITSGSTISFAATGGTSTGSFSSITNVGGGVYTATYTGITAGTAQTIQVLVNAVALTPTVSIQVTPGTPVSATSTLAISSGTVSSGNFVTVTATLRDINSNPVPSGILVAFNKAGGTSTGSFDSIVNAGSGVYTIHYTGLVSGTAQTLTVSVDGVTLIPSVSIQVTPGAPVLANSSLSVNSPTVTSGNFVTVTATLKDVNNNAVESGITVSFTKTGGTSTGTFNSVTNAGLGLYNIRYTGLAAGTAQDIKVLVNGVDLGLNITIAVTPGAPSASTSTLAVSSANVVSGQNVTVTATVRDANGNAISSGILVGFSKTGGTSTGTYGSVTNAGAGVYTTTYSGITAGTAQTLGIDIDNSPMGVTTSITVLPGAPDNTLTTFTVSSNTVISGQNVTLTATVRDANSNPISTGVTVTIVKSGGTSDGTLSSVTNQGNGVYTATFTGVAAGSAKNFQVFANMAAVGPSRSIQVLVGTPLAANSSLTVTTSPLASGNTATLSATIRDLNNNPITSEYAITFDTIGGSSTGNLGSVSNLGSGQFQTTYEGIVAGSAQTVRVLADGSPVSGLTASIQVIPGSVYVANSSFAISSSVVQSGTTANLTMNLRDSNNNAISSGLTVTFNKTAGVSDGTIGAVSNLGSGNYSAIYTATTQGAAQTITLVVNSVVISALNVSATVTAGPPDHMSITSPSNPLNSIDCNGPYTVTLQDTSNNVTSSLTSFTVGFSATPINSEVGTLFSDSSCTNSITGLTFGPTITDQSFYYKSYLPQSITLTLTPSNTVSVANRTIQNIAVVSWLGTALNFTMNGSGSTTVMDDSSGGLWLPYDSAASGDYLYVVDSSANRVLKYNKSTNVFIGWIGHIGSTESLSSGCSSNVIGDLTPVWCTGGRSSPSTTTVMSAPRGIAVDSTYLYVASGHRVLRFRQDTGAYQGWIGRVGTTLPPGTGQLSTCVSPAANNGTPGWCLGGTVTSGTGNGEMNTVVDLVVIGTKLYALDNGNARVMKFDLTTGAFEGWTGRISTQPSTPVACSTETLGNPTPTWCMGGTSQASNRYNLAGPPSEVAAPPEGLNNPQGIEGDSSYIYVADYANRRVVRIDTATGVFSGWIGRVLRSSAMSPTTPTQTSGTYTTTWTQGGVTQETGGVTGYCAVTNMKLDSGYLYITDICHRLIRVSATDGQDYRWIGRVTASPTGGYTGCSSTPVSGVTPGWCVGGSGNRIGNTNSAMFNPFSVETDSNYVYVADRDNFRIQKFDKTNGTFAGWIGAASSVATKWTRTPPTNPSRSGIDDYSFWDMTSGYTAITMNTNYMFIPDPSVHRIKKYNRLDGSIVGYIGQINTFAPTGPEACVGFTSGMTPDWCTGGGRTTSGAGIHGYNAPYSLAADSTYVYIVNVSNQRVDRVRISDALYMGWIGRINGVPTDGGSSCTSAVSGDASPTWCIGGSAQAGTQTGMLNTPRGIYYDNANSKLYIVDDGRLIRVNPSTGASEGTVGHVSAGTGCTVSGSVADSWCTTATGGNGTNNYGGLNDGTGIASDSTYIYVTDSSNHRIHRFNKSTGAPAGIIGRLNNTTNLNTSGTGGACASLTTGYPRVAPGWCFGTSVGVALSVPAATSEEGAFNVPRGIWADGTYLYITDSNNNRVVRVNASTGAFAGWKGYITSTAGMSDSDCIAAGAGNVTPKWCTGGTAGPAKRLGAFDYPSGIYGDSNYLYIHDGRNNRIVTIPK